MNHINIIKNFIEECEHIIESSENDKAKLIADKFSKDYDNIKKLLEDPAILNNKSQDINCLIKRLKNVYSELIDLKIKDIKYRTGTISLEGLIEKTDELTETTNLFKKSKNDSKNTYIYKLLSQIIILGFVSYGFIKLIY